MLPLSCSACSTVLYWCNLQAGPAAGALLECLGLAIVRAVDEDKGVVYILSPISDAQLQRVDTLQASTKSHHQLAMR